MNVSTPLRAACATALAAALLLGAAGAHAQQIVPAQSEIAFTAKQMGVPVKGKFGKWTAQIAFNPKAPESGSVAYAIDTGSAAFGVPETDAELAKPDWFSTAKFPQATFRSTSIKAAGPNRYDVAGTLTIKGQARNVVVPVTLAPQGANGTATGTLALERLDFKVGDGEWTDTSIVANDVQVTFGLALAGLPQ